MSLLLVVVSLSIVLAVIVRTDDRSLSKKVMCSQGSGVGWMPARRAKERATTLFVPSANVHQPVVIDNQAWLIDHQ